MPPRKKAEQARAMSPLARLIRDRKEEKRWTWAEIAERGKMRPSTVKQLGSGRPLRVTPRHATLEGLSLGLGIPLGVLQQAAVQSVGFRFYDESPTDRDLRILVAQAGTASPEARRAAVQAALAVLDSFDGSK